MARSKAFGLSSSAHAKKGAQAARNFRFERAQALTMAQHGNCKGALHAVVDAANYDGRMYAHGRSRSVSKRAGTKYRGRVYSLMTAVFRLCKID